jgi:hypothetical protein
MHPSVVVTVEPPHFPVVTYRHRFGTVTLPNYLITLWLVVLTMMKNMKVSGKDDIPYIMENNKNVPNHQPALDDGWVT